MTVPRRIQVSFAIFSLAFASLLGAAPPAADFQTWLSGMRARGITVSAGLWDLQNGKMLEAHQPDAALIPASTTKVVSSYAILKSSNPAMEIETEIWGNLQGKIVRGDLVFKGDGDPFLVSERLWMLAQDLKKKGIARITGSIRLDQSAFDAIPYEKGWANTSLDTTPPIKALAINFGRDEAGNISHSPEKIAIETITRIFRETGIAIDGNASRENALQKIHTIKSPPLRKLVQDVNKFSNNLMIEMLVKRFGDGTWPKGISRIQDFYKSMLDLGPDKIRITDGSGLSKENRLSARTLSIILRAAYHDFEVGPEFVSSLKVIGGEPWKMKLDDPDLARRIRCKTGHLTQVDTVCGYMQTMNGNLRVFAILLNGPCEEKDVWSLVSRWAK